MNEPTADTPAPSPPSPEPATPRVVRRRDWVPSLIWLIPIVAALVGVALVWRIVANRGEEIILTFDSAEGLEAGKTAVKYKEVQIGTVTRIRLARDRSQVRVLVQLNKDADAFTAEDTRYWIVRPRLDVSGVSGLGTLLSGAYIGTDPGVSEKEDDEFIGLEAPPIVTRDNSGHQYTLRAQDIGSLDIGSPVYFRRVKVGQVVSYTLDNDGKGVTLRVFVNSPYDKFVGMNTRFWHASGFDLQLNAAGVAIHTQSLATILAGGVAFQAPEDQMEGVAPADTTFALAADQGTAMKPPDGPAMNVLMVFNQSLRGLGPGAPVDFRGIVIGEVKSIGVQFDRNEREFLMPVMATLYPDRLRRAAEAHGDKVPYEAPEARDARMRRLVERGLRAQMRTGNLLTGQNYIALDIFPKAKPVQITSAPEANEIPTIQNSLDEIQSQVQEIATKINKIPFEELAGDMRKSLKTLDKTLSTAETTVARINNDVTPEIAAAMKDARKTINTAGRTLAEDSPLQQDVRQTLQELTRAAGSIRVLTDYLERHPESLLRGKPDDKK